MLFIKKYKFFLLISTLFAIAMAYVESSIVVYLRELYYPDGFRFPLVDIPTFILFTEIGREIATIVMLSSVASFIAKNGREWFAYFAFTFGIWDLWYYIWLKVLLDWPSSLFDWDVLFLIPIPWLSPVLAPIIVSISLIVAAIIILYFEALSRPLLFTTWDWLMEIFAGLIIIASFLMQTDVLSRREVPYFYPWWFFILGMVIGLFVFARRVRQVNKSI